MIKFKPGDRVRVTVLPPELCKDRQVPIYHLVGREGTVMEHSRIPYVKLDGDYETEPWPLFQEELEGIPD
jgi:hypothetical protein